MGQIENRSQENDPIGAVSGEFFQVPILSQFSVPEALPDFRNLGVVARILVIVNLVAFVAASIKSENFAQLVSEFLELSLVIEPVLIASMVLLFIANPWLARLPYWVGVALIAVAVLWLTAGVAWVHASVESAPLGILRTGAFALLFTAVLAGYFHLRNRAFSPALAEARLQALQARIRPHFLFNALNAVLSLIRKDARRAETALEDLAELYRMVMADNKQLTTLARELDLTRQYLNLEQLRLGPRLVVRWRIDEAPARRAGTAAPAAAAGGERRLPWHRARIATRNDRDRDSAREGSAARQAEQSLPRRAPAPAGQSHGAR